MEVLSCAMGMNLVFPSGRAYLSDVVISMDRSVILQGSQFSLIFGPSHALAIFRSFLCLRCISASSAVWLWSKEQWAATIHGSGNGDDEWSAAAARHHSLLF
jgi:hypothetical protein